MFTIKLYSDNAARRRIYEADDFTILRFAPDVQVAGPQWVEVTAHRKSGDDFRFDIGASPYEPAGGVWERLIIENAAGRTTEIIGYHAGPPPPAPPPPNL